MARVGDHVLDDRELIDLLQHPEAQRPADLIHDLP
jgi:hypothetical protein